MVFWGLNSLRFRAAAVGLLLYFDGAFGVTEERVNCFGYDSDGTGVCLGLYISGRRLVGLSSMPYSSRDLEVDQFLSVCMLLPLEFDHSIKDHWGLEVCLLPKEADP